MRFSLMRTTAAWYQGSCVRLVEGQRGEKGVGKTALGFLPPGPRAFLEHCASLDCERWAVAERPVFPVARNPGGMWAPGAAASSRALPFSTAQRRVYSHEPTLKWWFLYLIHMLLFGLWVIIGFRTKSLLKDFVYQILQYENEKPKAQKNSESSGLPLTLSSGLELETEPPNLLVRAPAPILPHYLQIRKREWFWASGDAYWL